MLLPYNNKALINLFEEFARVYSQGLNCVKVGKIQTFDYNDQTATIQIMHKKLDELSVDRVLIEYAVLEKVPCLFLGGQGTHVTYPVGEGDYCLLFFNDNEIDNWYFTGQAQPSDFDRTHDLSDAFALVGLRSSINLIQGMTSFLELHFNSTSYMIIGDTVELVNSSAFNVNVPSVIYTTDTLSVTGILTAGELHSNHGASGSFTSADNPPKTIVVQDGIIISITPP